MAADPHRATGKLFAVVVVAATLVVLTPLAILGFGFEQQLVGWFDDAVTPGALAIAATLLLASDVFLPVPSSFISTLLGARLGIFAGTAVSWLGMTAGAFIAYVVARLVGRSLLVRLADPADVARLEQLAADRGSGVLVVTRALPVLAETAVLLMATFNLPWRHFLAPVALANLGLSLAYATIGRLAIKHSALTIALVASVIIPLAATWIARTRWKAQRTQMNADNKQG